MPERLKRITQLIELGGFHPQVRHENGFLEVGAMIKDDVFVWGRVPNMHDMMENDGADFDQRFVEDLIKQARTESARV